MSVNVIGSLISVQNRPSQDHFVPQKTKKTNPQHAVCVYGVYTSKLWLTEAAVRELVQIHVLPSPVCLCSECWIEAGGFPTIFLLIPN